MATEEHDRVFALFFEANGLATVGLEPYVTLVPGLVAGWIEWAAGFIDGAPKQRRDEATAAIAMIDGLLLLRLLAGPEGAQGAATAMGVA